MKKRYDAHVRARRRLISRIVHRRFEWGVGKRARDAERSGVPLQEYLEKQAAQQLAVFQWPRYDWGVKYGRYYPIDGADIVGRYVDVPSNIIHSIMCTQIESKKSR